MKALLIFAVVCGMANPTDRYVESMTRQIATLYQANSPELLQTSVNAFDRIAQVESQHWEPLYYSAFGNIMLAIRETSAARKDQYLDLALASVQKAQALQPANGEITAMEGFVYMIRVTVDPGARGQQYSAMAFGAINKALAMSPGNPRALGLLAQMELGTARFFNASTAGACETARKALAQYDSFQPENELTPMWGREMTEEVLKNCH
ncbi:MAG: hypothetical protein K1X47_00125 [Cyclobacteriaceae bacterium]|nr:hypothetical protein [Cyclobacteriaceae bacterium]